MYIWSVMYLSTLMTVLLSYLQTEQLIWEKVYGYGTYTPSIRWAYIWASRERVYAHTYLYWHIYIYILCTSVRNIFYREHILTIFDNLIVDLRALCYHDMSIQVKIHISVMQVLRTMFVVILRVGQYLYTFVYLSM